MMRSFAELFCGYADSYGEYVLPSSRKAKKGEKFTGSARTHQPDKKYWTGPLDDRHYAEHLAGRFSLGVVPIRKDDTVMWFALDVDRYDQGTIHADLCDKITKHKLPFIVCRTKSDGAHVYCFFKEPIPAKIARSLAREALAKLGLGDKTEIFPKQDSIKQEGFGGSWINLPYFGKLRAATNGKRDLTLDEFLALANEKLVGATVKAEPVKADKKITRDEDFGDFADAPPCIQVLIKEGVEEGGRDNAVTHVGVFLKRAFNDDWQDRLQQFNSEHVTPKLGFTDMARIIKSHERKEYQYLCKQQPMCAVCDKEVCVKRKFGVGQGEGIWDQFTVDRAVKVIVPDGEPYYRLTIKGKEMKITLTDLSSFNAFKMRYFAAMDDMPVPMSTKDWALWCKELGAILEHEVVPEIVTPRGQIMHIFRAWCSSRIKDHNAPDNVVGGAPYYDEKNKAIVFAGNDLAKKVRTEYGSRFNEQMIWAVIQSEGGVQDEIKAGEKKVSVWKLPINEVFFDLPTKGAF